MNSAFDWIIKYRWPIIIFYIAITLAFATQLTNVKVDPDVQNMLPPDLPSRVTLENIEKIFGGTEMALVMVLADDVLEEKTLERIIKITDSIKTIKGIESVVTVPMIEKDDFEDEAKKNDPEARKKKKEDLREKLRGNNMVYGSLISKDFKAAAIIAKLKQGVDSYGITRDMRKTVESIPGDERIIMGGLPFIREKISEDVPADMAKFMPVGLILMLIFLFFCFKQKRGALLPFSVVVMSIIVTMGLVPLLGWKMMTLTILLPVLMIAISNNFGVYFISQYQQDNVEGSTLTKAELVKSSLAALWKPITADAFTIIAGMLCLKTHIIIPAAQLGILTAIGVFFALTASLLFIPAVMSLLPRAKPISENKGVMDKLLNYTADIVPRHPKKILVMTVVVTIILATGIRLIVVDSNIVNYYPKDSPIRESSAIVNQKFGGAQTVTVLAQGDMKNPEVLKKIDALEQSISKIPDVGNTVSISKLLRLMTKGLHKEGEPGYDKIPDNSGAVSFYYDQYAKMGNPEDLRQLVSPDLKYALITAQVTNEGSETLERVINDIKNKIKDEPLFTKIGGTGMIFSELIGKVIEGQTESLFLAIFIVTFIVMLLFRSFMAGIVGSIPIVLSVIFLFGIMGYAGITLDIATAILSSIMIGVGIDYTINYLWRYREERRGGLDPESAVRAALKSTGRSIIFNGLGVIVGFMVLVLSVFVPIRFFGILIMLSIITCLVATLLILPSILIVFKPKFLDPKQIK